jgi:sulfite reductase beta subunit-like hemoprotein
MGLPRKFKISFSGCAQGCAKPFINDLGFVLRTDGNFSVLGAGSLGPKPAIGIKLYDSVEPDEVLALSLAALGLFAEHGDRTNRRVARLRHVRQRFGDEKFKAELNRRFEMHKNSVREIELNKGTVLENRTILKLPDGDLSAEDVIRICDLAESAGARVVINLNQELELLCEKALELPANIAEYIHTSRVISCRGAKSCKNALVNSCEMARALASSIKGRPDVCVRISACPNDCVQSAVAQIGLIGLIRTVDGMRGDAYKLLTGGGSGQHEKMAQEIGIIPAQKIAGEVERITRPA